MNHPSCFIKRAVLAAGVLIAAVLLLFSFQNHACVIAASPLKVTYDHNDVVKDPDSDLFFSSKPRTAIITVTDSHFKPEYLSVSIMYTPSIFEAFGPLTKKTVNMNPVDNAYHTLRGTLPFTEDGFYKLFVDFYSSDAGESYDFYDSFIIDTVKPVLQLAFDGKKEGEHVFPGAVTAKLTITEMNYAPDNVNVSVKRRGPGETVFSDEPCPVSFEEIGNAKVAASLNFVREGVYTMDVTCTDKANNAAVPLHQEFSIDKTAPVMDVHFDSEDVISKKRTAAITIEEMNFDPALVTIEHEARFDGADPQPLRIDAWEHDGDRHVGTIVYDKDGEFRLSVGCKDPAGNEAETYRGELFAIDTRPPEIELTGVTAGETGKDPIAPVIRYRDAHIDSEHVEILFSGLRRGELAASWTHEPGDAGGALILPEIPAQKEMDDLYTLSVSLADKSGNRTSETFHFCVTRFGSVYLFSQAAMDLAGTVVREVPELLITEMNGKALSSHQVTLFRDNRSITLTDGEDYRFEPRGKDGNIFLYDYKISGRYFKDDGLYRLILMSKDADGRVSESSNDLGGTDLSFIVDNTPPIVSFLNIEEGKAYSGGEYEVRFTADDNLKLAAVTLILDDEPVMAWNEKEIAELVAAREDFRYVISGESNHPHTLRVSCADAAGNTAEKEVGGFLVTTNKLVSMLTNERFFRVLIAVVFALLFCSTIYLILSARSKSKKKRRTQAGQGTSGYSAHESAEDPGVSGYPSDPLSPPYPENPPYPVCVDKTTVLAGDPAEGQRPPAGCLGVPSSPLYPQTPSYPPCANETTVLTGDPSAAIKRAGARDPSQLDFGDTTVLSHNPMADRSDDSPEN